MGFFSQDCEGCGHPLLSEWAVNSVNMWMHHAVVILPNGTMLMGDYDGYGRINGFDEAVGYGNTVWHLACWKVAGSPTDHRGSSKDSDDQGYFFANEHDMEEPK